MNDTPAGIGLLYTFPSIYQMLRGSIIIFSGGLSVVFLKRKLYAYNLLGVSFPPPLSSSLPLSYTPTTYTTTECSFDIAGDPDHDVWVGGGGGGVAAGGPGVGGQREQGPLRQYPRRSRTVRQRRSVHR